MYVCVCVYDAYMCIYMYVFIYIICHLIFIQYKIMTMTPVVSSNILSVKYCFSLSCTDIPSHFPFKSHYHFPFQTTCILLFSSLTTLLLCFLSTLLTSVVPSVLTSESLELGVSDERVPQHVFFFFLSLGCHTQQIF